MLKFLTSDMKMEREEAKFLLFDLWDKLTMEDLGYFLYMQEMERQQQAEQEAEEAEEADEDD
jgi:hypothetical protein